MNRCHAMIRCLLCLSLLLGIIPLASAAEVLRVLAWDGYADAEVVAAFEQRTGAKVEVTYASSDDDLWDKLHDKTRTYDVFAVNTAELQRYIADGLALPLDLSRIPNHARQLPRFRDLSAIGGLVHDGKTYAVPYTYSEMGLIYNRKLVKQPPHSIAALWSPQYQGRVLAFNTSNHNFSLAALKLGLHDPFQLSPSEMRRAARELVQLRRNVLTFYATTEEVVDWMRRYDVALVFANFGTQQVKALRDAGMDIGYVIPREGALAWLDCWAVSHDVRDAALALRWVDYTLEPQVSERLTRVHGLANTMTPFPDSRPDARILWLQPLEDAAARKALWDRVLSGETPEGF